MAIALAREGADVVMSYLPDEQSDAAEVVALVEQAGRKSGTFPGDVSTSEYCRALIDTAVRELGGIDILINVAGMQATKGAISTMSKSLAQQLAPKGIRRS